MPSKKKSLTSSERGRLHYDSMAKCTVCPSKGLKPQIAVKGTNPAVCYHHGGKEWKAARGLGKHPKGKRSSSLPHYLIADYEAGLVDPRLLSMRDDIATVEARIRAKQRRIKNNPKDSKPFMDRIRAQMTQSKKAIAARTSTYQIEWDKLQDLIKARFDIDLVWADIDELTTFRAKLVKDEVLMMQRLSLIMTPELLLLHLQGMAMEAKQFLSGVQLQQYHDALFARFKGSGANTLALPEAELRKLVEEEAIETIQSKLDFYESEALALQRKDDAEMTVYYAMQDMKKEVSED